MTANDGNGEKVDQAACLAEFEKHMKTRVQEWPASLQVSELLMVSDRFGNDHARNYMPLSKFKTLRSAANNKVTETRRAGHSGPDRLLEPGK